MSNADVPVKTPLGLQELRKRSQGLGQRHRTVLLLVDGRRPLAEVLSMAHQAGAQTSHFEELLRLGMIELPVASPEPAPAAAEGPPAVDEAAPTAVVEAVAMAPDLDPPVPPPAEAPAPAEVDEQQLDEARRLLADILRRDTLLHRVFAPARVRAARTQQELIDLVWEIERERVHARRKRAQLRDLQRARELLGMGNTLVAEDSLPFEHSQP